MNNEFWKQPDLLVRTGSHLYGCAVEGSDIDTRGFVIEPGEYLLGRKSFEQHETRAPEPDTVIWGFVKFFNLLEKFSPNTVEILFAPKEHIIERSVQGQILMEERSKFVSKRIAAPMKGFALSEWNKAVNYLNNLDKIGDRRKSDIEKSNYSIKNAYHAIRLLEECLEILETGEITFPRPNAAFLRQVRAGEVSRAELEARWAALDAAIPAAQARSPIPDEVDAAALDELFFYLIKESLCDFLGREYKLGTLDIEQLARLRSLV